MNLRPSRLSASAGPRRNRGIDSVALIALLGALSCGGTPSANDGRSGRIGERVAPAGTFPITVDATALSQTALAVQYPYDGTVTDTTLPTELDLAPNTYLLSPWYGMYSGVLSYTITPDGKVDYDPAFEGPLQGRGTTTLTIRGVPLTFNPTALTQDSLGIATYGEQMLDAHKITDMRMPPATGYRLDLGPYGSISDLTFDIDTAGNVTLDPSYGVTAQAEGSALTLVGAPIQIGLPVAGSDAALAFLWPSYAKALSTTQMNTVTLMPLLPSWQNYTFYTGGAVLATFQFNVDESGNVFYDPKFTYAQGAGTKELTLTPPAITIDVSSSTPSTFFVGGDNQYYPSPSRQTLGLLPNVEGYNYWYSGWQQLLFSVTEAGTVTYSAPPVGLTVRGFGTSELDITAYQAATAPPPPAVPGTTIIPDPPNTNVFPPAGGQAVSVSDRGTAQYNLPIWTPPGRAGVEPVLSLQYSSGGGNGIVGTGWNLTGLSRVSRCRSLPLGGAPPRGIRWASTDALCLDGDPLVSVDTSHFRKLHDDGTLVTALLGGVNAPTPTDALTFEVRSRDGRIRTYGGDGAMVIPGGAAKTATLAWALSRIQDRAGNFMTFKYRASSGGDVLPIEIDYTGTATDSSTHRSVTFDYGARSDVGQGFVAGVGFSYPDLLVGIAMHAPSSAGLDPLRTYTLTYENGPITGRTRLKSFTECAVTAAGGPAPLADSNCRHETMTYANGDANFDYITTDSDGHAITDAATLPVVWDLSPKLTLLDVNGDGKDDLLYQMANPPFDSDTQAYTYTLRLSTGDGFGPALATAVPVDAVAPGEFNVTDTLGPLVLDFNGDGHADLLVNYGTDSAPLARLFFATSTNGDWGYTFAQSEPLNGHAYVHPVDLNGDRFPDLLLSGPPGSSAPVQYVLNNGGIFNQLSPPAALSAPTGLGLSYYYVDINGDGITDILDGKGERCTEVNNQIGTPICTCDGVDDGIYGAVDIGANLFPVGNPTAAPGISSFISGITSCSQARGQAVVTYTPTFGDFNGDGILDMIQTTVDTPAEAKEAGAAGNPALRATWALGTGPQSFVTSTAAPLSLGPAMATALRTMDGNLDGRTDLLVRTSGATQPFATWSFQGGAWQQTVLAIANTDDETSHTLDQFEVGDIDGDGEEDIVAFIGGEIRVYRRQHRFDKPDLLTGVTGSFGPTTTIAYAPYNGALDTGDSDCHLPLRCVKSGLWVVQSTATDNGVGGTSSVLHQFTDARADAAEWGFLGFKSHVVLDWDTGTRSTRKFDPYSMQTGTAVTTIFPIADRPWDITTTVPFQSNGQTLTRTTHTTLGYQVADAALGYFRVQPVTEVTRVSEESTLLSYVQSEQSYDPFGNLATQTSAGSADAETDVTTITYQNNADPGVWLVSLPLLRTVTATINGESTTRSTGYEFYSNGLLHRQVENPGPAQGGSFAPLDSAPDGVKSIFTEYDRDTNGLPTLILTEDRTDAPTQQRSQQIGYDAAEGMFPAWTTDTLGHTSQTAYEPGLGVVAVTVDANGLSTSQQYDAWGRSRAVHPPTGDDVTTAYVTRADGSGEVDTSKAGGATVTHVLDSLQRPVLETASYRADGQTVLSATQYDNLGRAHLTSRPFFAGGTIAWTTIDYDTLGRVIDQKFPDGSSLTNAYSGLTTTTVATTGSVHAVTTDTMGRPITSVQALTPGLSGLLGRVATTRYQYGPFGVLEVVTDTLGHQTLSSYDRTGRLRTRTDPDTGVRTLTYDIFDDVTDDLRAGKNTHTSYDPIGRPVSVDAPDPSGTGPDVTRTWSWDSAGYVGRLGSESISTGSTISFAYDGLTRLASKSWSSPRGQVTFGYTYDPYNRADTLTYPEMTGLPGRAPIVVKSTYSPGGQLLSVADKSAGTVFYTYESSDASEAFGSAQLANGVESTAAEDPSHPGWLLSLSSAISSGTVQSLTYHREDHGRVYQVDDTVQGTTEIFGYDALNRLTQWTWNGGAGARVVQWGYDDIGNLRTRTVQAGPQASLAFLFDPTKNFGPHQPTGLGTQAFAYDSHGNQTNTPGRTLAFNGFDLPTSVAVGGVGTFAMTYDPELRRASRRRVDVTGNDGDTATYSFGGLFEMRHDANGDHYRATINVGRPLAQVETMVTAGVATDTVTTLIVDQLGSVTALVPPSGRAERLTYDPFGGRVLANDPFQGITTAPSDVREGFTGHQQDDDVELIDMVGRTYDPIQGRFLSTDPAPPFSFLDGQSWNPYAYVRNNPVNAIDPTGYSEVFDPGVGNDFSTPGQDVMESTSDFPGGSEMQPCPGLGITGGGYQGSTGQDGTSSPGAGDPAPSVPLPTNPTPPTTDSPPAQAPPAAPRLPSPHGRLSPGAGPSAPAGSGAPRFGAGIRRAGYLQQPHVATPGLRGDDSPKPYIDQISVTVSISFMSSTTTLDRWGKLHTGAGKDMLSLAEAATHITKTKQTGLDFFNRLFSFNVSSAMGAAHLPNGDRVSTEAQYDDIANGESYTKSACASVACASRSDNDSGYTSELGANLDATSFDYTEGNSYTYTSGRLWGGQGK